MIRRKLINWQTWAIVNGIATVISDSLPLVAGEHPFPNPFVSDGNSILNLPVGGFSVEVEVYIFSADMNLVYSVIGATENVGGQEVIQWDGRTSSGQLARSGVYFFVADAEEGIVKGKFALIRR